jgi:fructokinase
MLEAASRSLKFLDINLRKDCYSLDIIKFSLGQANALKLNEDEAHQLGALLSVNHDTIPVFCETIMSEWTLQYCLVTLANAGAFVMADNGEQLYVPGYQVQLVDSLGAGDAFSAGFIHKALRGASLLDSCEFGNVLGAIVATQVGATEAIAQSAIDAFAAKQQPRNVHPELTAYIV